MDNLKAQTHNVLTKLMEQIIRQQKQTAATKSQANPESQPSSSTLTCKQLLQQHSTNLDAKQKMLLEVAMTNDLKQQMDTVQLKARVNKAIHQMNMDNNQFNIPESQLPKSLMSKTIKMKKTHQSKKTQPTVESHPQYFRVDHQICHKLFQTYRVLPLGLPKEGSFNFQQKQHQKNSMNYHKILQIFKDAGLTLQINQKLLILRSIKKFCFNQNFINIQEFIKVFKVIVHGLGYKQQMFEQFIKKKSNERQSSIKKVINSIPKPKRNYRFKTDGSVAEQRTIIPSSKSILDASIAQSRQLPSDKKMPQKLSHHKMPPNNASYLVKAMENQKISKITWDSLFNMKQASMHNYIVIPNFVRNVNLDQI